MTALKMTDLDLASLHAGKSLQTGLPFVLVRRFYIIRVRKASREEEKYVRVCTSK